MRENTDQKNSEYGHLWRSTRVKGVSRTCQTSIIELYAKIADMFLALTIFAKFPITDVWQGANHAYDKN